MLLGPRLLRPRRAHQRGISPRGRRGARRDEIFLRIMHYFRFSGTGFSSLVIRYSRLAFFILFGLRFFSSLFFVASPRRGVCGPRKLERTGNVPNGVLCSPRLLSYPMVRRSERYRARGSPIHYLREIPLFAVFFIYFFIFICDLSFRCDGDTFLHR